MSTKIEWTDVTDNIIVVKGEGENESHGWWCRKRSDGCKNCFSDKMNQNDFWGGNHLPYSGEPPKLILKTEIIDNWALLRLPQRHFVASMTDVFGEWLDPAWIERMLDGMAGAPSQTFQVLSKREDIMYTRVMFWLDKRKLERVPGNIFLGQSVENQAMANLRVPWLLKIPGRHFLSVEPLLAPVDLSPWITPVGLNPGHQLDWVIVGGETGRNSRPMHPDWARTIRDQCQNPSPSIPFFFKQWGNYTPVCPITKLTKYGGAANRIILDRGGGTTACPKKFGHSFAAAFGADSWIMQRMGKKAAGRQLYGREWNEFPIVPLPAHVSAHASPASPLQTPPTTSSRRSAALKAWTTMRSRYSRQELADRQAAAARKAWRTRREKLRGNTL